MKEHHNQFYRLFATGIVRFKDVEQPSILKTAVQVYCEYCWALPGRECRDTPDSHLDRIAAAVRAIEGAKRVFGARKVAL